jgi:hypothetical protein
MRLGSLAFPAIECTQNYLIKIRMHPTHKQKKLFQHTRPTALLNDQYKFNYSQNEVNLN